MNPESRAQKAKLSTLTWSKSKMQKRVKTVFSGTVQGVGFRASTESIARQYPITGYVRNTPGGHVEIVAEGDEAAIRSFIEAIKSSSLSSYIRNVKSEWLDFTGEFAAFKIAR